jgi:hypothetical protein
VPEAASKRTRCGSGTTAPPPPPPAPATSDTTGGGGGGSPSHAAMGVASEGSGRATYRRRKVAFCGCGGSRLAAGSKSVGHVVAAALSVLSAGGGCAKASLVAAMKDAAASSASHF